MIFKTEYKFNEKSLIYEPCKVSLLRKILKYILFFVLSFTVFILYYFFYTEVLDMKSPKYALLEKKLNDSRAKMEMLDRRFDHIDNTLAELQIRDNSVYRPIFGLNDIPSSVRNAGFGGTERYEYLRGVDNSGILTSAAEKFDILYKKAYVQTKSLDELEFFTDRAQEMAVCVPTISPIEPKKGVHRISSRFGTRKDPINHQYRLHGGIDIAAPKGQEPDVHVTGNGTVIQVSRNFYGFGNFVVVDHGFGYKTRYAHLKEIHVKKGDVLRRGDVLGVMGNSGRSTGTHLHYEVLYQDQRVNPGNYFNFNISPEDYYAILNFGEPQEIKNETI